MEDIEWDIPVIQENKEETEIAQIPDTSRNLVLIKTFLSFNHLFRNNCTL